MNDDRKYYDVVSIGSATVDYFAGTDSELIKIQTRESTDEFIAFPLGSKLLIEELNVTVGGGGTNSSVCFSRLGFKAAFLGKLGDDANGEFVQQKLVDESVDFLGTKEGHTGLSIILDSIERDRTILAYKGANNRLYQQDVPKFTSKYVYLSTMMGDSFNTVVHFLKQYKGRVVFNPSSYLADMGYEALAPILDHVELLILNKEEATKLMGLHDVSPRMLLIKMQVLAPTSFVITDGEKGVYVYDGHYYYHGKPMPKLKVVESTGAGDAFASTYTAALMMGESVEQAIHLAMTNAESVLEFRGAKEQLLTRELLYKKAKGLNREIEKALL